MLDKGKELDWFASPQIVVAGRRGGGRLRLLPRLGADRDASGRRPAPVRAAQLPDRHASRCRSATACSSATWCCCRCGCSSTWATPPPAAGLALAPVGLLAILLSPLVGKNVGRIDPRLLATVAFVGFAGVLWMRSQLHAAGRPRHHPGADRAAGRRDGVLLHPAQTASSSPASRPERIAGGLGPAATSRASPPAPSAPRSSTTLWDNRATLHHAHFVEALAPGKPDLATRSASSAAAGLAPDQALAQLNRLVDQQAFTLAATTSSCLRCCSWPDRAGVVHAAAHRPAARPPTPAARTDERPRHFVDDRGGVPRTHRRRPQLAPRFPALVAAARRVAAIGVTLRQADVIAGPPREADAAVPKSTRSFIMRAFVCRLSGASLVGALRSRSRALPSVPTPPACAGPTTRCARA